MAKNASALSGRPGRNGTRPRSSLKKKIKTTLAVGTLLCLSVIAFVLIYFVVIFKQVSKDLPSIADIGNFRSEEGTRIYYSDGALMAIFATENRRPVKLKEVSKYVLDATVAVEDARFYEHKGLDYYGLARAMVRNVQGGDLNRQGASTITQQLARNLSELGLTREKKLRRKVAEAILAMRIERSYNKEEILELYLNTINYGNGAYGIEAASRAYFHKSAKDLNLAEASYLAGLPQRPATFSKNRDLALRRRNTVLDRLVDTNKISVAEKEKAQAANLVVYKAEPHGTKVFGAPYFIDHVARQIVRVYGADKLYDGLKIYTTLDSRIQKAAEECLRSGLRKYGAYANQGCLVSIDPRTGYVRAMVGGVDYKRDQFNAVTQGKRQPGSSFKPIVYTAAIDTGACTLDSSYTDDYRYPGYREGEWKPKNYNGKYKYGSMSVLTAIKFSTNTIAVKVAMDARLTTVAEYAKRLGISTTMETYPPLALGSSAVRPIELCSAYSVFANDGKRALPMTIARILDSNGEELLNNAPKAEDTRLKPETVEAMNKALQEVVLHGTGTAAASVPEAHGKTGTTSNNIDAWFAGYTPDLATVIWVAREKRDAKGKIEGYVEMPGATGGKICAPIWKDFMLKALPIQQEVNRSMSNLIRTQIVPLNMPDSKPAEEKPKTENKALNEGDETILGPPTGVTPNNPDELDPDAPRTTTPRDSLPPAISPTNPGTLENGTPSAPAGGGATLLRRDGGTRMSEPSNRPTPPPAQATLPGGASSSPRIDAHISTSTGRKPLSGDGPRMSEPGGRASTPSTRRAPSPDELVSVTLCVESNGRATRWCPSTVDKKVRRGDLPGSCRNHKAPPGEDG